MSYKETSFQMQNVIREIDNPEHHLYALRLIYRTLMIQQDAFCMVAFKYLFVERRKEGSLALASHMQTLGIAILWLLPEQLGASSSPQLAPPGFSESPEAMSVHLCGTLFAYSNEMGYNWPSLILFSLS